jgi:hypothetical protein
LLYWHKSTDTDTGAAEQAVVLVNASINGQENAHLRKGAGPKKPLPPEKKKSQAVVRGAPVAQLPTEAASEAEKEAQELATAQARTK